VSRDAEFVTHPSGDWLFTDGDAAVSQFAEDQGSRALDRAFLLHSRTHVRVAQLALAVETVVLAT
jgi:hypothetical protein